MRSVLSASVLSRYGEGSMIVVSATGGADAITSWSNFGVAVDIAAPCEGIVTTVKGGGYGSVSGTSFSAPIVAGVVAMIKARRPDLTPAQVEAALFGGANDLGAAGKDPQYGHGRVNANGALAAADGVSGDTVPPTASVSAPLGGTVGGTVTVTASAADNIAVARVDLLVNGQPVASDSSAPYSFAWNSTRAANGSTTIAVKAYDNAGNSGLSNSVTLTVSNVTVADTTPPVVSILSPVSGGTVGGTTSITASASDAGGIASMKVYIDGKLEGSGASSSINVRWNSRKATAGNHTIVVEATDRAGNQASQSVSVRK